MSLLTPTGGPWFPNPQQFMGLPCSRMHRWGRNETLKKNMSSRPQSPSCPSELPKSFQNFICLALQHPINHKQGSLFGYQKRNVKSPI